MFFGVLETEYFCHYLDTLPSVVATYLVVKEGPVHTLERKDSLMNVH